MSCTGHAWIAAGSAVKTASQHPSSSEAARRMREADRRESRIEKQTKERTDRQKDHGLVKIAMWETKNGRVCARHRIPCVCVEGSPCGFTGLCFQVETAIDC